MPSRIAVRILIFTLAVGGILFVSLDPRQGRRGAEEGLGSSIGFLHAAVNLAVLLDADFLLTQTAGMMGYRVSDYINQGRGLRAGARVCDIMEVLLSDPGAGNFTGRMDRARAVLDATYAKAQAVCRLDPGDTAAVSRAVAAAGLDPVLSDYARAELARCDALVINDHRVVSYGWSRCSMRWWRDTISPYSGPAHGNDVAIHFRWGDMYAIAQTSDKWRFDMGKVARVVDAIRDANPTVAVRVFMKRSERNESDRELRALLAPLSGKFAIVEARSDIEELAMLAKARYLVINAGTFSTAAAATANAQVVVHNGAQQAKYTLNQLKLKHVFDYNDYDEGALRDAARLA
ncbi:hypothetical protein Q5752_000310 [Cryptotrichosporon argae]